MEFKFKIMKSQMLIKEGYGFIYAFYSAGNWIQGFINAKEALYHRATSPPHLLK